MTEDLNPEAVTAEPIVCKSCGSGDVANGYPAVLCHECRKKFIRYPVPNWVKLFGGAVLLLFAISLWYLPGNLMAGILLSRAKKAVAQKKYVTAQRYLEQVTQKVPNATEAQAYLMIASFYNLDLNTFSAASAKAASKQVDDDDLLQTVNGLIERFKDYYPSDSLAQLVKANQNDINKVPDEALKSYLDKNSHDEFALYDYASRFYGRNNYKKADSIVRTLLVIDPQFMPALYLETGIKRELQQADSSLYYCNRILDLNAESVFALSSKARTLFKSRKISEGIALAKEAERITPNDLYNNATLAIGYHLNRQFKERDELVRNSEKDTASRNYMQYAKDVITGKVKYN